MVKLLNLPEPMRNIRQFEVFDDFLTYTDGDLWDGIVAGTGAVAIEADAKAGEMDLSADADDDEAYLATTQECFLFAEDKPMEAVCRIRNTDGGTNTNNIVFGFSDNVASGFMTAVGAGPHASYSGALIYAVDGTANWQVESSIAATQTTTSTNLAVVEARWLTLRIMAEPVSSTSVEITYFIDNSEDSGQDVSGGQAWVQLKDANSNLIKHTVDPTSATEMHLVVGLRAGAAATNTLEVDYPGGWQLR